MSLHNRGIRDESYVTQGVNVHNFLFSVLPTDIPDDSYFEGIADFTD